MNRILFWFRRDLRVHDNVGLYHARKHADELFTLFVLDSRQPEWSHRNPDRLEFKLGCVDTLADRISDGSGVLLKRHGVHGDVFRTLLDNLTVDAVYWNRCYEPYERERDEKVEKIARENGVEVHTFKDQVIFEKREITTQKDDPYKVFTPYAKRWKATDKPEPVDSVEHFDTPRNVEKGRLPSLEEMGMDTNLDKVEWDPGEKSARTRFRTFMEKNVQDYDRRRDFPAEQGTSRCSPYLRFGCLSARTLYWECRKRYGETDRVDGIETFVEELIWRDFYHQILYNFPRVARGNFHEKYDDLEWNFNEDHFRAWREGRTGYPIVDAGMRQLNETGWMHNRLRMIVASFLTKDLLIHWKHGERYFMNRLLDGDTAANNGGWQWAASTGTDAVPYFRIFNPVSQSKKYDPEGRFIRTYCPELGNLADEFIHEPFEVDSGRLSEAGIELGVDYPEPILDHSAARERALSRFESVRS